MRLHRQPRPIKRRPHSHIRHAPMTARLSFHHRARYINAPRRQQLLPPPQIKCRTRNLPPPPPPRHHFSRQRERPPQHPRRPCYVALRNHFPDHRARHNLSVYHHRLVHNHVKSVPHSQFPQKPHVPRLLGPESKIYSHHHRPHLQVPY